MATYVSISRIYNYNDTGSCLTFPSASFPCIFLVVRTTYFRQ